MRELPRPLRRYLWFVYAGAATAAGIAIATAGSFPAPGLLPLVVLSVLAAVSELLPISYGEEVAATPITAFLLAVIVLLPPVGVLIVVLAGSLPAELASRKPWYKIAFNVSARLITYLILTLWSPALQFPAPGTSPLVVITALLGAIVVYMILITALVLTAVGLSTGHSLWEMLRDNYSSVNIYDHSLAPYGLMLGWLWEIHPAYFAVGVLPLAAVHRAFKAQGGLLTEKRATARLLAQQQEVQAATADLLTRDELRAKLESVVQHLIKVQPARGAYVVLWSEGNRPDTVVTWGESVAARIEVDSPAIRQLCQAGQITHMPVQSPRDEATIVIVPLATGEDVVGGMFLLADEAVLTSEMRTLLETFAAHAALALAQAGLIEQLKSSQLQLVQSARLAAIGTLAAGVAHEFNNLLAAILGSAELALLMDDREEHVGALKTVVRVTQQGGSISRGLLAFSRQLAPRRELANLHDAVTPVLDLYQRECTRRGVRVVRRLEPVPPTICDIGMLSQVVLNLLTNALDAMHQSGGVLTVELGQQDGGIRLLVSDTGGGIDPAIRDQIFEPFATNKTQQTDKLHGGSGLGLAIVYGIITDHGGHITVDSQVGCGTTMRIWLPVVAEGDARATAPAPDGITTLRAVVVDDEPMIAKAVHGMLSTEGHAAEWFSDSRAALDWMRGHPVDVMFVDLTMPEIDGLQLLEQAQEIHPNLRPVVITGQIEDKRVARAHELGVTAILEKPFSIKEIRGVIQAFR